MVKVSINLEDRDYVDFIRNKPRGLKKGTYARVLLLEKLDDLRVKAENAIIQILSEKLNTGAIAS